MTTTKVTTVTGKVAYDIYGSWEDCSPGLYVDEDKIDRLLEEYVGKKVRIVITELPDET